jgi:hypothetical protein
MTMPSQLIVHALVAEQAGRIVGLAHTVIARMPALCQS